MSTDEVTKKFRRWIGCIFVAVARVRFRNCASLPIRSQERYPGRRLDGASTNTICRQPWRSADDNFSTTTDRELRRTPVIMPLTAFP